MLPRLTCCGLPMCSFLGYEDLDVVNPQSSGAEKVDSVDADDVRCPRSPLCSCQNDGAGRRARSGVGVRGWSHTSRGRSRQLGTAGPLVGRRPPAGSARAPGTDSKSVWRGGARARTSEPHARG